MCLSVCLFVRDHISGTAGPIGTKFCARIHCGRGRLGPPPAALRYVMYFRFVDDVTFSSNGRDTERWRLTRAATAINDVAESDVYESLLSPIFRIDPSGLCLSNLSLASLVYTVRRTLLLETRNLSL